MLVCTPKQHIFKNLFSLKSLILKIEPPNMTASAAAVKSIIGEVFSDVSFEEFERGSSTVSFSEK